MMLNAVSIQSAPDGRFSSTTWNGPICPVCNERYLGRHDCKGHQCEATRRLERIREHLATEGIDWTLDD